MRVNKSSKHLLFTGDFAVSPLRKCENLDNLEKMNDFMHCYLIARCHLILKVP